ADRPGKRRSIQWQRVAYGEARAVTAFGVFVEHAIPVIGADRQAVRQIEQVGLAETDGIALELIAGHGFCAKLLARAAKRPPFEDVLEAGREPQDIEVALVEDDAAENTAVRVQSAAQKQAARARFLDVDEHIFVVAAGRTVDDRDG